MDDRSEFGGRHYEHHVHFAVRQFFNPVLPEVQEYLCSMLKDLAAYDGLAGIFLDRGRFDGFTSDFSNYTRKEFEKYIGRSVASFPADILPGAILRAYPRRSLCI